MASRAFLPSNIPWFVLLNAALVTACTATSSDSDSSDGKGDSEADGGTSDSDASSDADIGSDGIDDDFVVDGGDDDGDPAICETIQVTSKPNPPVILILLDQSGSMNAAEAGTTRWEVATTSIDSTVSALEGVADFGLIGFPTHELTINGAADASQSCNAHLKSAPAPNNAAALSASIVRTTPTEGHTPVRAALNLAQQELSQAKYAEKNKYVVLVTDGLPNCKGIQPIANTPGPFANYEDPSDAVTVLRDAGINTYVVGYAIAGLSEWSESVQHFAETYADNMASAGGTVEHSAVSTGAELQSVLEDITASVAPCSFELNAAPRGGASYVRVTIDGTDYALDESWVLEGETTISLNEDGPACAALRDGGEHNLQIQVECQPVVVL